MGNVIEQNLIEVPADVRSILRTIRAAGHEAFIVGGCVRDSLLGRVPDDWDITTSALPLQVKSLFHYTVDTGIQHGTVMVLLNGKGYEVTTYRIDGNYTDGRHPDRVEFTPSLEEDLKRRDFTINAFAYDPENGIVDLFGGMDDLQAGIVRAVGDPRRRFSEDALRIMRAVRFSAQLSFTVEKETREAIREFAPKLAEISAERIRVEFEKTLFSAHPSYVAEYRELGLAEYIVQDVREKCFDPASDALYERLEEIRKETDDRPEIDEERVQYLRLAMFFRNLTPPEAGRVIRKMTFDNRTRDMVCGILKNKEWPLPEEGSVAAQAQVRAALRDMGQEIFELVLLYKKAAGENVSYTIRLLRGILEAGDAWNISMLKVNGSDLIEVGIPKGIGLGRTLQRMLEAVIEEPGLNRKEILLSPEFLEKCNKD